MDQNAELKERLLNIVEEHLMEYGYHDMSVDAIAATAGISKKTLYVVFRSKEDMTEQVLDRLFERLDREMEKVAALPDPLERFRKGELVVEEIISPIERKALLRRPFFWHRVERLNHQRLDYLMGLFREAQEKGLISSAYRPEILALSYSAGVKALADHNNRVHYSYPFKLAAEQIVDVFLEGLKPR